MKKNEDTKALSKRELEVLRPMAAGASVPEIAAQLFISEHTVKNHIKNMHKKAGVKKNIELVMMYMHILQEPAIA